MIPQSIDERQIADNKRDAINILSALRDSFQEDRHKLFEVRIRTRDTVPFEMIAAMEKQVDALSETIKSLESMIESDDIHMRGIAGVQDP